MSNPFKASTLDEIMAEGQAEKQKTESMFTYDSENNTLTIDVQGPYEIDLDRIKEPDALMRWAYHLTQKKWVTSKIIGEFINQVCKIKEWRIHGL